MLRKKRVKGYGGISLSASVGVPSCKGLLSHVFFSATGGTAAGAGHGRVLGHLLLSWTGSGQHGSAQDVQQGAAPGDEDGGAELKPAAHNMAFVYKMVDKILKVWISSYKLNLSFKVN